MWAEAKPRTAHGMDLTPAHAPTRRVCGGGAPGGAGVGQGARVLQERRHVRRGRKGREPGGGCCSGPGWGQGCCCNRYASCGRGEAGHLRALQWEQARHCPWDKQTYSGVIGEGNLETLRWAKAQGCAYDDNTCSAAAQGGHLNLLR